MPPPRFVQRQPRIQKFQHGEDTAPFTVAQQTAIKVPKQIHREEDFAALFVLDADVTVEVRVINTSKAGYSRINPDDQRGSQESRKGGWGQSVLVGQRIARRPQEE